MTTKKSPRKKSKKTDKPQTKTEQVEMKEELPGKVKRKKKVFDEEAFYSKYSHVIKGSIQEVERGTVPTQTGVHSHGRICIISCEDCGAERVINVQDAFQTRYCIEHQKERARARARKKRMAKKEAQNN